MALPQKPYHPQLHKHHHELGTQSRRQWGRTDTAKPGEPEPVEALVTTKQSPLLDVPLGSAPGKTDMHGLIMRINKDICSFFDSYLPNH